MFQKRRSKVAAPVKATGPAWTRGEIEKPTGTKDMGGYKAAASHLAFKFLREYSYPCALHGVGAIRSTLLSSKNG